MKARALLVIAISTVFCGGTLLVGSERPMASVEVTGLDPAVLEQKPLADAATGLMAFAGTEGFASVTIDDEARKVYLYWRGDPPASVIEAVEAERARGVEVILMPAKWTLGELDREVRRIGSLDPATAGLRITGVGPLPDMSGIRVRVHPDDLGKIPGTIVSFAPLVFSGMEPLRLARGRWEDISPFWGGAMMDSGNWFTGYTYCSAGFAVRLASGTEALLTANHCGTRSWATPHNNQHVGVSVAGSASLDVTTLSGKDYSPRIYTSLGHEGDASKRVVSKSNPAVGVLVRSSGAASGAEIVQVTSTWEYAISGGVKIGPGFYTVDPEGAAFVGYGDSGGPVGKDETGDDIRASGIIVGYIGSGTCEGWQATGRQCGTQGFNINIEQILTGLSVTLQTAS